MSVRWNPTMIGVMTFQGTPRIQIQLTGQTRGRIAGHNPQICLTYTTTRRMMMSQRDRKFPTIRSWILLGRTILRGRYMVLAIYQGWMPLEILLSASFMSMAYTIYR